MSSASNHRHRFRKDERPEPLPTQSFDSPEDLAMANLTAQLASFDWEGDLVMNAYALISSDDIADNLKGVLKLKEILCTARAQVFKIAAEVIHSGVVPRLVTFIDIHSDPDLQLASAFCLTNIAAGSDEQTAVVVQGGAVPGLMKLLDSRKEPLRRQAIFCLANIAGSTPEFRVRLAADSAYYSAIFNAIRHTSDPKVLEIAAWNLRNICVLPGPSYEQRRPAVLFFLEEYTRAHNKPSMARYCCEAIKSACASDEGREDVSRSAVVEYLVDTVGCAGYSNTMRLLALDALCEFAGGGQHHKDRLIMSETIPVCTRIFETRLHSAQVRHRALGVLAALARNSDSEQARSLIGSDGVSAVEAAIRIFMQMEGSEEPPVREAAASLLGHAIASVGDADAVRALNAPVMQSLLLVLEYASQMTLYSDDMGGDGTTEVREEGADLFLAALTALERLLYVGERLRITRGLSDNPGLVLAMQLDVRTVMENLLRSSTQMEASRIAARILEVYFMT